MSFLYLSDLNWRREEDYFSGGFTVDLVPLLGGTPINPKNAGD